MSIHKDIDDLVEAGVIDQSTAERMRLYYQASERSSSSLVIIIFGALGALLIGLGIILILAHNWDQLPRLLKTVIAFIPLVVGQGLCGYTLWRRQSSQTWVQASAIFLTLAVGASIALVSQIYHLEGDLSGFILIWVGLAIPVVYVMRATAAAMLCVLGSIAYALISIEHQDTAYFWISLALVGSLVPYYISAIKQDWKSNALSFLHFLIPINILCSLAILLSDNIGLSLLLFINVFGLYYMLGHAGQMTKLPLRRNGYVIIGALGTVGLLLAHTYTDLWKTIHDSQLFNTSAGTGVNIAYASTLVLCIVGLAYHFRTGTLDNRRPVMPVFLISGLIYFVSSISPLTAALLTNLLVVALAVLTIMAGVKRDHLGVLNYGLLIMTALLMCRFFDFNISFVLRGLLFIAVGISFFLANSYLIKRRSYDEGK